MDNFHSDNWGGDKPDELMKCIHCDYTMNDGRKSDTNQRLAVDHLLNNHINQFDESWQKGYVVLNANSKCIDTYLCTKWLDQKVIDLRDYDLW